MYVYMHMYVYTYMYMSFKTVFPLRKRGVGKRKKKREGGEHGRKKKDLRLPPNISTRKPKN